MLITVHFRRENETKPDDIYSILVTVWNKETEVKESHLYSTSDVKGCPIARDKQNSHSEKYKLKLHLLEGQPFFILH